jgi:hypothetical protein
LKTHYFYNPETKITQWDHPLDHVYKSLVVKARQASKRGDSILDDTCVSIQDLLTYEDDAKPIGPDLKSIDKTHDGDSSLESSLEEEINISKSADSSFQRNNVPIQKPGFNVKKSLPSLHHLSDNMNSISSLLGNRGESNTFPRATQFGLNRFKSFDSQQEDDKRSGFNNNQSELGQSGNRNSRLVKQSSEIIDLSFNPSKQEDSPKQNVLPPKKGLVLSGKKIEIDS